MDSLFFIIYSTFIFIIEIRVGVMASVFYSTVVTTFLKVECNKNSLTMLQYVK